MCVSRLPKNAGHPALWREKKKKKSLLLFSELSRSNKTGRIKKIRTEPGVMLTP